MNIRQGDGRSGFTIVELLIVIVVIGILAAVVVVAYNGIQNRAHDSAVSTDLRNTGNQIMQYQVLNSAYPRTPAEINNIGQIKLSRNSYGNHLDTGGGNLWNFVYCLPSDANPNSFALVAASKSGKIFAYVNGSAKETPMTFGPFSDNICSAAGSPIDSGEREWFFNNSWSSFVD